MSKQKRYSTPRERTTLPLRGAVSRLEVQLDFPSSLAVAYARQWLKSGPAQTDVDVLASGVIRRSLAVYMGHLNNPTIDPEREAREVKLCCFGMTASKEAQEGGFSRLAAHQKGHDFPSFRDCLYGPDSATRVQALNDQVDRLLGTFHPAGRPKCGTRPPKGITK